eukprot:snap_masked-scaffold_48-processed-gene-0.4-mRNA-1 protein AED:1.00 eAED:1.00 QI:0/0/0/0/1/1/2/0/200
MKIIIIFLLFVTIRSQTCVGEFEVCLFPELEINETCCEGFTCVDQNDIVSLCEINGTLTPTPNPSTGTADYQPTSAPTAAQTTIQTPLPTSEHSETGSSTDSKPDIAEEGTNRLRAHVETFNTENSSHKTAKVLFVHSHRRRSGETERILNRSISGPRTGMLSVLTYPQTAPTEIILSKSVSQKELDPNELREGKMNQHL